MTQGVGVSPAAHASLPAQSLLFYAHVDLEALDIMRGRDWGLPSYAQAVAAFRPGATPIASFADITSDASLQARLAAVYESPADVDLFVGGMVECAAVGSSSGGGGALGQTFAAIVRDQMQRSRDGDRLYFDSAKYLDSAGVPVFTAEERATLRGTNLGDILARTAQVGALHALEVSPGLSVHTERPCSSARL